MCRRIVIECTWDDDEVSEGYPGMFDPTKDFDEFTQEAENILWKELTGLFDGQIAIRIERMHGQV